MQLSQLVIFAIVNLVRQTAHGIGICTLLRRWLWNQQKMKWQSFDI